MLSFIWESQRWCLMEPNRIQDGVLSTPSPQEWIESFCMFVSDCDIYYHVDALVGLSVLLQWQGGKADEGETTFSEARRHSRCYLFMLFDVFCVWKLIVIWSFDLILDTAMLLSYQTLTETFVISMLPQDGDWRFRCESDHEKRFEKLWLQAFGLVSCTNETMGWTGQLAGILHYCSRVIRVLGSNFERYQYASAEQVQHAGPICEHLISEWV